MIEICHPSKLGSEIVETGGSIVQTFIGRDGFRFLDEREMHLTARWFHYSPPETFAQMFRSPDWALWGNGEFEAAIETMRGLRKGPGREADRTQVWAAKGVDVVRLQVVDAESIKEPESPLNYLLTYLAVTHPDEDRLIIDGDKCAVNGITLPDIDFLIHDDDAVFTKYEGEPSVIYRDAYFNRPPSIPVRTTTGQRFTTTPISRTGCSRAGRNWPTRVPCSGSTYCSA